MYRVIAFFAHDERRIFSFANVSALFTPRVHMMATPNSLSNEGADTFESLSYLGILPLPLSDFGLGRDVLSSCGDSFGPLSLVELGLSFGRGLCRISSSFGRGRIPRCRFVENDVATYPNRSGQRVEALVCLFYGRVSYEDTFLRLRIELLFIFVWDAYIRNASEHLEVREDWLPSNEDLVWS